MVIVTVSLMVHIYTIGYMAEDPDTRFFGYIALFTFAMLMLVMSNNFPVVFRLGAVGLVYLLIGFWYERMRFGQHESVSGQSRGRFRVHSRNWRCSCAGSLDYQSVRRDPSVRRPHCARPIWLTVALADVDLLLFVGAMGKSARCLFMFGFQFHGRSDPDLSPHSRGDYGYGGHLPSSTDVSIV